MVAKSLSVLAIFAVAAASAGDARAQTGAAGDARKPKRTPSAEPTIVVTVTNQRTVALVELDAAAAGSPVFKAIAKKLGPGQKTVVTLTRGEECRFDLHVSYADGTSTDISDFDLCKDGKINLVD